MSRARRNGRLRRRRRFKPRRYAATARLSSATAEPRRLKRCPVAAARDAAYAPLAYTDLALDDLTS